MRKAHAALLLIAAAVGGLGLHSVSRTVHAADKPEAAAPKWSPQLAAKFMDSRETWWQGWEHSNRDHGTKCISCHTQAPYAIARPTLHSVLGESGNTPGEAAMLRDVERRVREWDQMLPFYDDKSYGTGKEIESRNAEAVLNAFILTSYDRQQGHLSPLTRTAYDHAWALQLQDGPDAGAWMWQNFDYTPWESKESQFHWAALLAVAISQAPDNYRLDPKISHNLWLLQQYLRSHYDAQPTVNKVCALWASRWNGTVTPAHRKALTAELTAKQRPDGGWSMADLGDWKRRDGTPIDTRADGYATGLIVLVLEQVGMDRGLKTQLANGRQWLETHQDPQTGAWPAWSLNKDRDPKNPVSLFMSDAATGYAVLALDAKSRF